LVLEPIFEADMEDCAYGYRPKRSAIDAVKAVHGALIEGYTQVVDAHLSKFFDRIAHDDLIKLNRMLKGWEGYFHDGSRRKGYRAVNAHVGTTVRGFLQRRHKVSSRGTRQFSHTTIFNDLGVHEMGAAR
jgi:hypothetical protein